jgi:hypothetical protein
MWDDRIRVVGYQHAELPRAADFPHQVRRSDLLKQGAVRLVARRPPAGEYKVVREVVDVDFGPLTAGTGARRSAASIVVYAITISGIVLVATTRSPRTIVRGGAQWLAARVTSF